MTDPQGNHWLAIMANSAPYFELHRILRMESKLTEPSFVSLGSTQDPRDSQPWVAGLEQEERAISGRGASARVEVNGSQDGICLRMLTMAGKVWLVEMPQEMEATWLYWVFFVREEGSLMTVREGCYEP
jgi:hypothetical protein